MSFQLTDAVKNRIVIVLAVLLAVLFITSFSSCNSAIRQKAARDKEMAARLALEERISKFSQSSSELEEKAKAKEKESEELKAELEKANKALAEERLINQSLRDELDKVAKLKENLELDLQKTKEEDGKKSNMK